MADTYVMALRASGFGLAVIALLASACVSDPEPFASVADQSPPAAVVREPTTTTVATTTTTEPEPLAPPTAPPPTIPTTTSDPNRPETDIRSEFDRVERLGRASFGKGEWVTLRRSIDADSEGECADTILGYWVNDDLVHAYTDLRFNGGIRLFANPNGQDAFVLNCEESVEAVWIQPATEPPPFEAPGLVTFDFAGRLATFELNFAFLGEWGWRGATFAGFGSVEGEAALWAFDRATPRPVSLADEIGTRETLVDASVVVPQGWTASTRDGQTEIRHPSTLSQITITVVDGSADAPSGNAANTESLRVMTWDLDGTPGDLVDATDYTFVASGGLSTVRHVKLPDRTVVIEVFADDADFGAEKHVPFTALDLLRVFR